MIALMHPLSAGGSSLEEQFMAPRMTDDSKEEQPLIGLMIHANKL